MDGEGSQKSILVMRGSRTLARTRIPCESPQQLWASEAWARFYVLRLSAGRLISGVRAGGVFLPNRGFLTAFSDLWGLFPLL